MCRHIFLNETDFTPVINVLMSDNCNDVDDKEPFLDNEIDPNKMKYNAGSKLKVFYQLAHTTKSSINSSFYAVTGIKLDQKKLVISFIFTLIKDFTLAYTARAALKLIPRLVKMLQNLK